MVLHVYTVCWNERLFLPYFLRHYQQYAARIVVYDHGSDDGSQEIVRQHSFAELRHVGGGLISRQEVLLAVKNGAWKESRGVADWVVCCDVDELLYHHNLAAFLNKCQNEGVTIPAPFGYQMVSDSFPTSPGQVYDEVRSGIPSRLFSKRVVFDPNAISEIGYKPGCHKAAPSGRVISTRNRDLKVLHYKFMGLEYVSKRYAELALRRSAGDRRHGYSQHYETTQEHLASELRNMLQRASVLQLATNDLTRVSKTAGRE